MYKRQALGLPKNRIIGMGGALDSSRFKYFLSQALGCNANEVEGMVIGCLLYTSGNSESH